MQAVRDAATLAGLILIALTVRVHLNGAPVEVALGTPAEAAMEAGLPATRHTLVEPIAPEPARAGLRLERRTFVWTVDGQRVGIVVHVPQPPPTPCPLAAADPGHSC